MKVKRLIELLETQDPNAEVYIASQPSYPIEYTIAGVAIRRDALMGDDPDLPNPLDTKAVKAFVADQGYVNDLPRPLHTYTSGVQIVDALLSNDLTGPYKPNDVVLCEGNHVGYSYSGLWSKSRR
jgi:hypothetical protein